MKTETQLNTEGVNMARRSFLRYAGTGVAAVGLLTAASCHKDKIITNTGIDIGNGDVGILNFAYALEQLEAAFYIQVAATPYSGITATETARLTDIRDHEVCHREFFKAALGSNAIQALTPDFSSIDFSNRAKVLAAAQAFEDTGVGAYNGAGYLIQSATYLGLAGKIVSVEARHASYIRDLISPGSFGDTTILDVNGMDQSKTIAQVLPIANTYLKTKVNASNYGYVSF
ncbi:MAG TPA: ferritin-like domain-containing protein [Mucilaginibacter sp.]